MPDKEITERLLDLLENIQKDPKSSNVSMDKFQLELIIDQATWRGGITERLDGIGAAQETGFEAINKRLDQAEEDREKKEEKTDIRIGEVEGVVNTVKGKAMVNAAIITFLTALVLMGFSKLLHLF